MRPLTHPLTGSPLNHRPIKRVLRHDFLAPWLPANAVAAGYPAADILCPPWLSATVSSGSDIIMRALSGYEGYLRMGCAAGANATATIAVNQTVHLAPSGLTANRYGLHLFGLRYGNNAGGPSTFSGATIAIHFDNTGATNGFKISQASSASYATLTVHGSTTILMDGSGGEAGSASAVDLRDYRAQQIGVEFEPRDNEVIITRTTPDERRIVVWRRVISGITKTTAIQPRVIVTNEGATQMQLQMRRIDFEVWS